MDKYVPFEKMSKRAKQDLAKSHRGSWHGINPVTRKPENPKAYNRRKVRREDDFHDGLAIYHHSETSCIFT